MRALKLYLTSGEGLRLADMDHSRDLDSEGSWPSLYSEQVARSHENTELLMMGPVEVLKPPDRTYRLHPGTHRDDGGCLLHPLSLSLLLFCTAITSGYLGKRARGGAPGCKKH